MIFEHQYKNSLVDLINKGEKTNNRTGVDTLTLGHQYFLVENISENFPMLRGKKIFPKMALKELFWMLNGRIDIKWLEDRGVNYWKEWANADGNIGKSYGYQFRNFNGKDNFLYLLKGIIENPLSRRHILNLWNINDLNEMELPPCVFNYHFALYEEVSIDYLKIWNVDLHITQRSGDSFLGIPYDIMFSSWFNIVVCDFLNHYMAPHNLYIPRNIHHTINIYHLYENHYNQALQYIQNVNDNKNNIITDSNVNIENKTELPYFINTDNKTNLELFLKEYIESIDKNNYKDFIIHKNFEDVYGKIEAPIAI